MTHHIFRNSFQKSKFNQLSYSSSELSLRYQQAKSSSSESSYFFLTASLTLCKFSTFLLISISFSSSASVEWSLQIFGIYQNFTLLPFSIVMRVFSSGKNWILDISLSSSKHLSISILFKKITNLFSLQAVPKKHFAWLCSHN